jgi:hypothetical protein
MKGRLFYYASTLAFAFGWMVNGGMHDGSGI